ncbi:MAG: hypothetical protein RIE08_09370 [Acidimicrobiales bacterium]|jgi:hypothetical protein
MVGVIIGAYAAVNVIGVLMLALSGAFRDLFSRFSDVADLNDNGHVLRDPSGEWIENHEFWELSEVEEVAF